jgi:hypothetical protein
MKSKNARGRAKPPHLYPKWTVRQDDFARRFALALVRGQYPDALAAARACQREYMRTTSHWIGHHVEGVHIRIGLYARKLGRPPTSAKWSKQELRIVERFARAAVEGRFRSTLLAAQECRKSLDELAAKRRAKTKKRVVRRSIEAVRGRLFLLVKTLPGRLFGGRWTPAEDRIIARYASSLAAGQLQDATTAGRECHRALLEYARQLRQENPAALARSCERTLMATNLRVREHAYRLGWTCFQRHPWSLKEKEIARKWTRRYRTLLKAGVAGALGDAGRGMRAELRELHGFRRTLDHCKTRLWHLVHEQGKQRKATSLR